MYGPCSACHNGIQLTLQQSFGGTMKPAEEDLPMSAVVNVKVEFRDLGSFSYTTTLGPRAPETEVLARPPYTFPKPIASQEPDEVLSLPVERGL